jgi:hypothetical protein
VLSIDFPAVVRLLTLFIALVSVLMIMVSGFTLLDSEIIDFSSEIEPLLMELGYPADVSFDIVEFPTIVVLLSMVLFFVSVKLVKL